MNPVIVEIIIQNPIEVKAVITTVLSWRLLALMLKAAPNAPPVKPPNADAVLKKTSKWPCSPNAKRLNSELNIVKN